MITKPRFKDFVDVGYTLANVIVNWEKSVITPEFHQICVRPVLNPSIAHTQGFCFTSAIARCINLAKFSNEQTGIQRPKQQHDIWLISIIKLQRVDASTKISKKETNPSTSSNPSVENTNLLSVCCFVYKTYLLFSHESGIIAGDSSVSQLQLSGSAAKKPVAEPLRNVHATSGIPSPITSGKNTKSCNNSSSRYTCSCRIS